MVKRKKGISPAITWVLLLAFAISLAMIVTTWYRNYAKELTEDSLEMLEGGIECEHVRVNVVYTEDVPGGVPEDDHVCKGVGTCYLKIVNVGSIKIDKVQVNEITQNFEKNPKEFTDYCETLARNPETIFNINCATDDLIVTPIVVKDKKQIKCSNDRIFKTQS